MLSQDQPERRSSVAARCCSQSSQCIGGTFGLTSHIHKKLVELSGAPRASRRVCGTEIQGGFCRQRSSHRNVDSKIGPGGVRKPGRKPKENVQKPHKPTETQGPCPDRRGLCIKGLTVDWWMALGDIPLGVFGFGRFTVSAQNLCTRTDAARCAMSLLPERPKGNLLKGT